MSATLRLWDRARTRLREMSQGLSSQREVELDEFEFLTAGVVNAWKWGVEPSETEDCGPALQGALDLAGEVGADVWLPPADLPYTLKTPIVIPAYVKLRGPGMGMRRGLQRKGLSCRGTQLWITSDMGLENAITLDGDSAGVVGIDIDYPDVSYDATPSAYGWTIAVTDHVNEPMVHSVNVNRAYKFLTVPRNDGVWVSQICGRALLTGIHLGRIGDVPHISHIRLGSNAYPTGKVGGVLDNWTRSNGTMIEIDGSEHFMLSNIFGYGWKYGVNFTGAGDWHTVYGSISDFGFDVVDVGVRVSNYGLSSYGVAMTNGVIIANIGAEKTAIVVDDNPSGQARASNTAPLVEVTNVVSKGGGNAHAVWVKSNATGRVLVSNGSALDHTGVAFRMDSSVTGARTVNWRVPSGTRVGGTQSANVTELNTIG